MMEGTSSLVSDLFFKEEAKGTKRDVGRGRVSETLKLPGDKSGYEYP